MNNRHLQQLFLLAATTCWLQTTAKVAWSSTEDNSDHDSMRISSESEPPAEIPFRRRLPTRGRLPNRVQRLNGGGNIAGEEFFNESPPSTICTSTSSNAAESVKDGLHDQVTRLTNELSKAVAALNIAQHHERKLTVLEREKYSYVKAAKDKVLGLVDNVQHAENRLNTDTCLERQVQLRLAGTHQTQSLSHCRSQLIRRLLSGAEVGLVHLDSGRMLSARHADANRRQQQTRSHVPH